MIGGDHPFYLKFWVKLTALELDRRFLADILSYASIVTHSEKVQLTLTGSPLYAFQ